MSANFFPDLRGFLEALDERKDLVRVQAPVDPFLEAPEIHRRVIAAGGPALRFDNPTGSDFPLVTNLFGTADRALLAFGQRPGRLIRQLVETLPELLPPRFAALWKTRSLWAELLRVGTRTDSRGEVLEVLDSKPDLNRLPSFTCWPEDGGPFITLPLVHTSHPQGLGDNLGMYRMQVFGPRHTGMHWQIGKGGGFHYQVAADRGEVLPVTVFLGGPPALILSAIAPLPENAPEMLLASLILGKRIGLCRGPEGRRLVAGAEFALIGDVAPGECLPEGPFGDHYGYYSLQHAYPVFRVRSMAHRRDAIYPATVVGKPRQEDFFIGDLLQELLSPLFPLVMPAVEDLWSYGETGYHSLAAAVVKERYQREAMTSAFRILGEGQLSLTKFLFLTNQKVDLRDFRATLQHILERTHSETDLYVFPNLAMDTLDYTGPQVNRGSKGVWLGLGDSYRELPGEFAAATLPQGVDEIEVFCPGCLVINGPDFETEPDAGERLAGAAEFSGWPLIVLSDEPRRAARSAMNFLWTTFTRFEPATDIYSARMQTVRTHLALHEPILIDARIKPWYPKELSCSEEVARQVTRRWKEYFPERRVEMGDSEKGHLD